MEKFTKGPWSIDNFNKLIGVNKETITVSRLCVSIAHYDDVECEANNNLIATAPEMYEKLKEIVNDAKQFEIKNGYIVSWREEAELILAKARGE